MKGNNYAYQQGGSTMRIIETNNFNGDYPDEKFLNIPSVPLKACQDDSRINQRGFFERIFKVLAGSQG
jgi:hypothetical protein